MSGYEADSEEEIPDDCFHMVTQYNWEEDIIWNGDDIKHKVQCMKVLLRRMKEFVVHESFVEDERICTA